MDNRQPEKSQPSFSAYRPEAYAANDRSKERPAAGRPERPAWDEGNRSASSGLGPTSEPFPRAQSRDPYYQGASDPYANPGQRGYENDWRQDPYPDQGPHQLPNFYPTHDEQTNGANPQQMHDHFFASDRDADPQPLAGRLRNAFDGNDFGGHQPNNFAAPAARDYAEPSQRHHGVHGFDENQDFEWEKYEQPPAPPSVRPFHPPATIPDDDMDADFFADEDDYDADDYGPERGGGRKRLMAAVLVGAVVTGGGLAYLYKSSGNLNADEGPSLISADNRPVKEEPADAGGRNFPGGSKLIYERLGQDGAQPQTQQASVAATPGIVTTTGGTLEERIENALKAQKDESPAPAANEASSPDKPRPVRTLTFGPDGNPKPVEARTQRVAAAERPSAAKPTVPESVSSGIIVTTEPTAASSRPAPAEAEAAQPTPAARPARLAAATPAAAPAVVESTGGSAGQYFVQIGARNDEGAAVAAFATMQQKYASVLGNHAPSVRKADLGDKGVWYRLMVGPMETKADADQLCEQLKTAGMKGCFSRKE
jgi:cell division protein FtsN